jgi:hypothetical protein
VEPQHVNANYVLWATSNLVDLDRIPAKGLVARIELSDRPEESFWMLLRAPHPEICTTYLGWAEDVTIRTDSETLARWHLRHLSYEDAARSGRLQIEGSRPLVKTFVASIRPSPFAETRLFNDPGSQHESPKGAVPAAP